MTVQWSAQSGTHSLLEQSSACLPSSPVPPPLHSTFPLPGITSCLSTPAHFLVIYRPHNCGVLYAHTQQAPIYPPKHTLPLSTTLFIPPDVSTALLHSPLAGGYSVVAVVVIYNLYVVFSGFSLYMKSLSSEQRRRQGLICLVRGQGQDQGRIYWDARLLMWIWIREWIWKRISLPAEWKMNANY